MEDAMKQGSDIIAGFVEGMDVSGYGIARSLGRKGVPIFALNDQVPGWVRFSGYYNRCYVFQDDPTQPRTYRGGAVPNDDAICKLLLKWRKDFQSSPVLFCGSDWFSRLLSYRQQDLCSRFLYHWIPIELFNKINNKWKMTEFCERAGVCVPHSHFIRPEDDIEQVAKEFSYPCLVKPLHRHIEGFQVEGKVFIAQTAESLKVFFETYPKLRGATLIQELIEGGDDQIFQCTALVKSSGEVGALSVVRKLQQYPPGYGMMCRGRTETNKELASEAIKLLDALGYRGLGSMEFKYRKRDGRYYFIEMNTRLPWYNGIFADAGINLAYLAYLDLTGQSDGSMNQPNQRNNVTWISLRDYSKWYMETQGKNPVALWRWLASVVRADSYAWWNWKDPFLFIASFANYFGIICRRTLKAFCLGK
jgi:predicted ATP-grasp superfamily ATP-dependent carboligase